MVTPYDVEYEADYVECSNCYQEVNVFDGHCFNCNTSLTEDEYEYDRCTISFCGRSVPPGLEICDRCGRDSSPH